MIDNIQEQSAKNAYCSELDEILEDLVRDSQEDVSDFKLNSLPREILAENRAKQAILDLIDRKVKEAELQARIDEARKIYTNYIPAGTLVGKAVLKRIKRYKAERNKLTMANSPQLDKLKERNDE